MLVAAISVVTFAVSAPVSATTQKPVVTPESAQKYLNPVALFAHGKYLWVSDNSGGAQHHGAIYRIDIATGKSVAILSPLLDDPLSIFSDGTDLWIGNQYGGPNENGEATGSLLKLDIATNELTKVLNKVTIGHSEMTSNGKYLWFLNTGSVLTRMNIATGTMVTNDSLAIAGEGVITSDKNYLWLGGSRLLRISKTTNKIKVIDPKRFTDINELVSTGTNLWLQWGNRHLVDLKIATDAVRSFYNPKFEFNYGIVTNGHYVWMTDDYNRTVLQFDATTGKVTEINSPLYSSGQNASHLFAITSEGKNLWVTVSCQKFVNGVITGCSTVVKITP